MKLQNVFVMFILINTSMIYAMQEGGKSLHCLAKLAHAENNTIGLSNPLEGDHNLQRLALKGFMAKLPEVVIGDGEGNFEADMTIFRKVLVDTVHELPKPKGEALDLTDPNLQALEAQGARLVQNVSQLGTWGKHGAIFATGVAVGMIVGWFYTTKAHHAAAHHMGGQ